jgi:uncharacterized iron-regulated membrane protein
MRKLFFWLHLTAGLCAGTLILTMCVTGTLLMYERQINSWSDHRNIQSPPSPAGTAPLAPEDLLAKVRQTSGVTPSGLWLYAGAGLPAEIQFGEDGSLLVNPYTGDSLGSAATRTRRFFSVVKSWHRWFGMGGSTRNTGKTLMDAGNLVFFLMVLSGLYLWFPRSTKWQYIRPVLLFRRNLSGKARDFNWHNVIGVWAWVPLFLIVGCGVVMSYSWANNLVFRVTGTPLPAPGNGGAGGAREGKLPPKYAGLNQAWSTAEAANPGWTSMRMPIPTRANTPLNFTIDRSDVGLPQGRGTLLVDQATGNVVSWMPYSEESLGRRVRLLMRFTHTGESLGIAGQTIAGIATAGGGVMVCTGFALSLRRLWAWRRRRRAVGETLREKQERSVPA